MKIKKIYGLYLVIILFVGFTIWIFNRPTPANVCAQEMNICLLKGKLPGFWARMGAGFSCVFSNIACLIESLF